MSSQKVNLNNLNLAGERILIVDVGLSRGNLAKGVINLEATAQTASQATTHDYHSKKQAYTA